MKEHREKKLANKDNSSMPTTTDTHQSQGSRFVNNDPMMKFRTGELPLLTQTLDAPNSFF
jgi:hypothetical protein